MKLYTGTSQGRKYSIQVTPACERTYRDKQGGVHESSRALAVGAITGIDKACVANMVEREYSDLSFEQIRTDMRNKLVDSVL